MQGDAVRSSGAARARIAIVVAVLTLALAVRAWQPQRLGLGHYDEGVYAISATGIVEWPGSHLFPGQTRFSPPAWFGGVGVVSRVLGAPPDRVAPWLNIGIGAATAAGAAAIGMAWFGVPVGAAAGVLLAVDPLGVMLSRSGLTDPLFTFWFLLAIGAMVRAVERGGWRALALAGLLTGLAWNTKYHGWFVGVVGVGAITGAWWWGRRQRDAARQWRLRFGRLVGLGLLAALCYLPWAIYMRQAAGPRGFGSFVEYYLTLIDTAWVATASRHVAMQLFLDTPLARVGLALAAAVLVWSGRSRLAPGRLIAVALLLVVPTLLVGTIATIGILVVGGLLRLWPERTRLPVAACFAWLGLWVVAAPFYHPYARLLLPMMLVTALLAAIGLEGIVRWAGADEQVGLPSRSVAILALVLGGALWFVPGPARALGDPWRDASGSQAVAVALDAAAPGGAPIHVLGEPSIAHYLTRLGREAPTLTDDFRVFDSLTAPVYLAAGVYSRRAPNIRAGVEHLRGRLDSLGAFAPDPTDLRLLDDLGPGEARRFRRAPDTEFDVVLYRIRPASAVPVLAGDR
ncbi:MAG: glycosyltransferase family 39 protein [Gemmatimonadetes bacterium]|nr:glycosyltransferase family 39 protein [Gemmatimonadota bacterium]MCB9505639.1 glycosyltransferase family 39 protein [Gemmatimonadales bacterium]HRX19529.1 glycosyltransferase family 39 protein [Gemmatimonadales bacterium]